MKTYVIKRVIQMVPVLFFTSVIIFGMVHLSPGDPAIILAGGHQTSPETLAQIRAKYHLDKPIVEQYLLWARDALHGNLGVSFRLQQDVTSLILQRLPISLELVGLAMLLTVLMAFPLGIVAAVHEGRVVDWIASLLAFIGVASPVYFTGILAVLLFAFHLGWLPAFGTGDGFADRLAHLLLPAAALALNMVALTSRMMRASMLETLNADYMRTALAKGVSYWRAVLKHAARNALIPVVTVTGLQVGFLLVGSVLVEYTFGIGGLGSLIVDGVQNSDYPIVQGTTLFVVVVFLVINLIVDLLYALIDPRVRYN
ncbi:MAG: ABC transporter permease [Clostridia bacterium]|nr:ABC transporter permease [Clostridia bacterium]